MVGEGKGVEQSGLTISEASISKCTLFFGFPMTGLNRQACVGWMSDVLRRFDPGCSESGLHIGRLSSFGPKARSRSNPPQLQRARFTCPS